VTISKLIASQKFEVNIDFGTLEPADSNVVKILITKTIQMSYLCHLIWQDFSQAKFLEKRTHQRVVMTWRQLQN